MATEEKKAVTQEDLDREAEAIEERHPSYANLAPMLATEDEIPVTEAEEKLKEVAEAGQTTAQGKVEAASENSPKEPPKTTAKKSDS